MTAAIVIYNCKRCKIGRRVEYSCVKPGYLFRVTTDGKQVPAGVWVVAIGGGKPTVYGGDTEMGLCSCCGKAMTYGKLEGHYDPTHKCDARCTSARGHNCECQCGGVNHGAGWAA